MLGTELNCAPRSRRAYSVYCLRAGDTPLSNPAREKVHGGENRKREYALKCKQALLHGLSLTFNLSFIYKQIYSSLQKSNKAAMKEKCMKADIDRMSRSVCNAVFLYMVDVHSANTEGLQVYFCEHYACHLTNAVSIHHLGCY